MSKELPTIYLAVGRDEPGDVAGGRAIIGIEYTRSGTAVARRHYSGDIVGRAGGGGYCKTGVALAEALTKIYGIPLTDGGRGEDHVIGHALGHGVRVVSLGEALYSLPTFEEVAR